MVDRIVTNGIGMEIALTTVLHRAPGGRCERRNVDLSELTPSGQTTQITGWGGLDGLADIYAGPAAGEYLVPRA